MSKGIKLVLSVTVLGAIGGILGSIVDSWCYLLLTPFSLWIIMAFYALFLISIDYDKYSSSWLSRWEPD